MKQKLTIALDQEKIKQMEVLLKNEEFRSKSHLIEYLLNIFLRENLRNGS